MRPWKITEVQFGKMVRFHAGDQEWRGIIERCEPTFHIHLKHSPVVFSPGEALGMLEWFDEETRLWKRYGVAEDYDK